MWAVIRYVERMMKNGVTGGKGRRGKGSDGFWAKITGTNGEGRYSWVALKIVNGNFVEAPEWGQGSHLNDEAFAAEKNQSKQVPIGSVVWLRLAVDAYVYLFEHQQEGFWAKIQAGNRSGHKYSWDGYSANADGTFSPNGTSGSYNSPNWAQPSDGSHWVLPYETVWLRPSGLGYYVFDYHPGMMTARTVSTDGGIPGRQGATPGQAEVILDWFNGIALNVQDSIEWTVLNSMRKSVVVDTGKTIYLHLSYGQGVWWVSGYDCTDEDEDEETEE
ncbi:hypothetical protein C5Y96_09880 [Blastopirellula marina]|uniref:Uncharacterized protein n=1 Tax=Blastopirellula marina TaxID=124 RepID=A0A2S8FLU3_9BACT|nr:hypothetical protein C5Y96_09880 [Blastopirellula marina]RCS52248.1 hypothetical protein DTL36_09890 [Bremerella cremea]